MNVPTVVGMMADGADVKEGRGRLGSACPLHASLAPSEVVVGGGGGRSACGATRRGEKPRSGEQTHEYLMGCADHIGWSAVSEPASRLLH